MYAAHHLSGCQAHAHNFHNFLQPTMQLKEMPSHPGTSMFPRSGGTASPQDIYT